MEKNWHSIIGNNRCIIFLYSTFVFCLLSHIGFTQSYSLADSIVYNTNLEAISANAQDQILVADKSGKIFRYDTLLEQNAFFSLAKPGAITSLEAWNPLACFVFFRERQEWVLLDRFLVAGEPQKIPEELGFIRCMAPAQDGNFWAWSDEGFSLKKLDRSGSVISNLPMSQLLPNRKWDIKFMRAYNNLLFVSTADGTIIEFDNMGNFKRTWKAGNFPCFSFSGESFIFERGGKIIFRNTNIGLEKEKTLPGLGKVSGIASVGSFIFILSGHRLYKYKLNSN